MASAGSQFIDINGAVKASKGTVVKTPTVSADELQEPENQAKIITDILKRLAELERVKAANFIEFEVSCPASGSVSLNHGFGSPAVRYTITSWKASSGGPNLRLDETNSTSNLLVLVSGAAGRATIKVELSNFGLTQGNT